MTAVTFFDLSDEEIAAYVAGGEPLDKAGAYGFQGVGSMFVSAIDGPADSVIGLPRRLVGSLLSEVGVEIAELAGTRTPDDGGHTGRR